MGIASRVFAALVLPFAAGLAQADTKVVWTGRVADERHKIWRVEVVVLNAKFKPTTGGMWYRDGGQMLDGDYWLRLVNATGRTVSKLELKTSAWPMEGGKPSAGVMGTLSLGSAKQANVVTCADWGGSNGREWSFFVVRGSKLRPVPLVWNGEKGERLFAYSVWSVPGGIKNESYNNAADQYPYRRDEFRFDARACTLTWLRQWGHDGDENWRPLPADFDKEPEA